MEHAPALNQDELEAHDQLSALCTALKPSNMLEGWKVHASKNHGMQYIHQPSGVTVNSAGAAILADLACGSTVLAANAYYSEDQIVDEAAADAADEAQQVLQIITCLDKVVVQL